MRQPLAGRSRERPLTALSTAYVHGLNFCSGNFVIIMDADFSHHASSSRFYGEPG
jgi:hypothetical protein